MHIIKLSRRRKSSRTKCTLRFPPPRHLHSIFDLEFGISAEKQGLVLSTFFLPALLYILLLKGRPKARRKGPSAPLCHALCSSDVCLPPQRTRGNYDKKSLIGALSDTMIYVMLLISTTYILFMNIILTIYCEKIMLITIFYLDIFTLCVIISNY
jgi:hypothetical protein